MKKLFPTFCIFLVSISSLMAQSGAIPNNILNSGTTPVSNIPNPIIFPPSTLSPNPVPPSASTPPPTPTASYPIGSFDAPVSALEYWTFLTDSLAPQQEKSLEDVQQKYIGFNNFLGCYHDVTGIVQFGLASPNLAEQEAQTITSLPTLEAQQLFNKWRSNPTSQELLDYMIDVYHTNPRSLGSKFGGSHPTYAPGNILQLYPNSTTLGTAKNLALFPVGGSYLLFTERGPLYQDKAHPEFNIVINPKDFIKTNRYTIALQPDYHRPIGISK